MRPTMTDCTIALICVSVPALGYSTDLASEQQDVGQLFTKYGDSLSLGNGRIYAYQTTTADGKPYALGIAFTKSTLSNLPTEASDGLNCWDTNGDNTIQLDDTECSSGHQRTLFFDTNLTPFKFITVNWEPNGHVPVGIYNVPHFDFHFYMMDYIARNQIAVGPCFGMINCAHIERGIVPVPSPYIHPDFFDTKLVFPRMGNHWVDATSPEFNKEKFSHTLIFGSYEGHITFVEPMVSLEYLLTGPKQCSPIKQPALYENASYYPTQYCIRFQPGGRETYTISLEGFEYRTASPY